MPLPCPPTRVCGPDALTIWKLHKRKWAPSLRVLRRQKWLDILHSLTPSAEQRLLLQKTWVGFRKQGNKWNAGCEICAYCKDTRARAFRSFRVRKLTFAHLKRHQHSSFHKENLRILLGVGGIQPSAPSAEQFQRVWDELMKGTSPNALNVDKMKGRKVYRMIFCLAEALFSLDRAFARKATVGSMRRDESQGRLLIYFTFVTPDLQSRTGVLGISKNFNGSTSRGARAITDATEKIFRRFATQFCQMSQFGPPVEKIKVDTVDEQLFAHCLEIQVQTIIDAAADEQVSFRQMQMLQLNGHRMFPNLRLVTLDHCHATSRILKRGFGAVPALGEIMKQDIQAKGSITQLIQNSKVFRDFFLETGRKSSGPASDLQSLCAAKHRYESYRTPLIRSVLRYDSLMTTAAWIYHHRRGQTQGQKAEEFLQRQTTERILLRGMMSDAAEETINLLRFSDVKRLEIMTLPREISAWNKRPVS